LSVRTLQRELTQVGSSYRNLVKQLRFERASELLREGNLNVSQIAAQLGYSTSAHFARAFRRESGLPPNEFRMLFGARNDLASQSETQGIQINESASTDNRKF
jgi:AraC-like DNA-binding protein